MEESTPQSLLSNPPYRSLSYLDTVGRTHTLLVCRTISPQCAIIIKLSYRVLLGVPRPASTVNRLIFSNYHTAIAHLCRTISRREQARGSYATRRSYLIMKTKIRGGFCNEERKCNIFGENFLASRCNRRHRVLFGLLQRSGLIVGH